MKNFFLKTTFFSILKNVFWKIFSETTIYTLNFILKKLKGHFTPSIFISKILLLKVNFTSLKVVFKNMMGARRK